MTETSIGNIFTDFMCRLRGWRVNNSGLYMFAIGFQKYSKLVGFIFYPLVWDNDTKTPFSINNIESLRNKIKKERKWPKKITFFWRQTNNGPKKYFLDF